MKYFTDNVQASMELNILRTLKTHSSFTSKKKNPIHFIHKNIDYCEFKGKMEAATVRIDHCDLYILIDIVSWTWKITFLNSSHQFSKYGTETMCRRVGFVVGRILELHRLIRLTNMDKNNEKVFKPLKGPF